MTPIEREAKLNLIKYEQLGFLRGFEAVCDQLQIQLRESAGFADLEGINSMKEATEGGKGGETVEEPLRQQNPSMSIDVHYADAIRCKEALDALVDGIVEEAGGMWVIPMEVRAKETIKSIASGDFKGDVRRVVDMCRTAVVCENATAALVLHSRLAAHKEVKDILHVRNGFVDSLSSGLGGYRDLKISLQLHNSLHVAEVQVHLQDFFKLNRGGHEVAEWARGLQLPENMSPQSMFTRLEEPVREEMIRLVTENWVELKHILPELLQASGNHEKAEPLLKRGAEEAEKKWLSAIERHGVGSQKDILLAQSYAMALNNLGMARKAQGNEEGAEPTLRRALEVTEASFGPEHQEVATRLNSLALLLAPQGKLKQAEELHSRALEISLRVYGESHSDVATYKNNLARVLKTQGRLAEAAPLQQSALEIGLRTLGKENSDVAVYYNNLSRLLRSMGKLEAAEPLQREAVEIGERVLGPTSELATWTNNLARLLKARGKLDEAEATQRRAVKAAQAAYGPDHPETAKAERNLAKMAYSKRMSFGGGGQSSPQK
ncbi:unnamed protein product [Discosporangium mesarthrocarpum]